MQNRRLFATLLCLSLVLTACAAQRAASPQLSPETRWELNTADQLSQLERDYRQVFTDVGNWQRAGQVTPAEVVSLNAVGARLKTSIENANRLFKTWQASRNAATKTQVIAAVNAALSIFVELTTRKAQIATT